MIQEYLFVNNTYREEIEKYKPDKVDVIISAIDNSHCWVATYTMHSDNEDSAKILSSVNNHIISNFSPTVLSNGSSAYYNQRLFPEINKFERKLRKLLYLKSALYDGENKIENIQDLEQKDLGSIFELLFTDTSFVQNVKSRINDKTWKYTKKEILSAISAISEETIWDKLIGHSTITLLRENFTLARQYRNDVMHAHNIDTQTYKKAKGLFKAINSQLDQEINAILGKAIKQTEVSLNTYNEALSTALRNQNLAELVSRSMRAIVEEYTQAASTIPSLHDNYEKMFSALTPLLDAFASPQYEKLLAHMQTIVCNTSSNDTAGSSEIECQEQNNTPKGE